jgi:2-polyprenyl-3-methyl-5-hydroxy-6-metoxy-1,4-benzoquinol methylase
MVADDDEFFAHYQSTHVKNRKLKLDLKGLERKSKTWTYLLGDAVPLDMASRILDAGCGSGAMLWWLQKNGYKNAEGVDISQEQIKLAVEYGVKNVLRGSFPKFLDGKDGHYDLIVLKDVIEHIDKEIVISVLRQCHLALKPDGKIIIQVPNSESPFFGRIRYGDFTHKTAFCQSSLMQILLLSGFINIKCRPLPPIYQGINSLKRVLAWGLVSRLYKMALRSELGPGEYIVTQNIIVSATRGNCE